MRIGQTALLCSIAGATAFLAGCSSHIVSFEGAGADCAAGACTHGQSSIMGAKVYNSDGANGYDRHQCGRDTNNNGRIDSEGGFRRVEVKRNAGQGLLNLLTLGLVNQATIEYSCVRPQQVSDLQCDFVDLPEGQPLVMQCASTDPQADEPTGYDCEETGTDPDTGQITFTCDVLGDASMLNFIPFAPETAKG